ncbi:hypothetical protein [Nostoc sp.]|uniref:hypothetical protein n=1 Tax=Nostoc sp. TaxID=1180 RepID=UPI002FF9B027
MKVQEQYEITKRSAAYTALLFIVGAFCIGYFASVVEPLFRDRLKITVPPLFPQAVGLILPLLSWTYVKDVIEDAIESDVKIKKKEIEEEYEKKSPEAIQEKQELEYLAWLANDKKYMDKVNFNKMSTNVRQKFMEDRDKFENELSEFKDRLDARQQILEKLLNKEDILLQLVRETGDHVYGKSAGQEISKEENKKYLNIYSILRVWLLCSIKFDCVMPVESLQKIISKDEIKALEYFRDTMLDHPNIGMDILPDKKSREIVKDYIDKFVKQVNQVYLA